MGLILPQEVEVKWNGTSKQHYIENGYTYTNNGDVFKCSVLDLSKGSAVNITIKCDFCNSVNYIKYKGYLKLQSDKYCCPKCLSHKKKSRDDNGNLIFIEIPYRNKEWLYQEYIVKNRLAEDIANDFKINPRTLREWIHIFGLNKINLKTQNITKDILEDLYTNKNKTTLEIADIFSISDGTVLNLLYKYNIYIPTRSELMNTYYYKKDGILKTRKIAKDLHNRIKSSCRQRGISIDNFNGFKRSENSRFRTSAEYLDWRKFIFTRDNYTCQSCKQYGGNLHAHHIINFSSHYELRLDINNGITLCEKCHSIKFENSFHKIYGENNNTKEQLQEFLNRR